MCVSTQAMQVRTRSISTAEVECLGKILQSSLPEPPRANRKLRKEDPPKTGVKIRPRRVGVPGWLGRPRYENDSYPTPPKRQ